MDGLYDGRRQKRRQLKAGGPELRYLLGIYILLAHISFAGIHIFWGSQSHQENQDIKVKRVKVYSAWDKSYWTHQEKGQKYPDMKDNTEKGQKRVWLRLEEAADSEWPFLHQPQMFLLLSSANDPTGKTRSRPRKSSPFLGNQCTKSHQIVKPLKNHMKNDHKCFLHQPQMFLLLSSANDPTGKTRSRPRKSFLFSSR